MGKLGRRKRTAIAQGHSVTGASFPVQIAREVTLTAEVVADVAAQFEASAAALRRLAPQFAPGAPGAPVRREGALALAVAGMATAAAVGTRTTSP